MNQTWQISVSNKFEILDNANTSAEIGSGNTDANVTPILPTGSISNNQTTYESEKNKNCSLW